ncbi:SAC3 family protein C-like [Bidens hawaiensis]|uniref:SAC3 family protein C-like n=1 Tax=Bidens hawaiensis TaxID=980011 RepID=UPI00404A4E83
MERWQPRRGRGRGKAAYSSSSHTQPNNLKPSNTFNHPNTRKTTLNHTTSNNNNKQDNNDPENLPNLTGSCPYMCPVDERTCRERLRDLAVFERLNGNPSQSSSTLAVKKFCRTISTADVRDVDLRPVCVLEDTLNHLLNIFGSKSQPFDVIHDFVFDRTRSIRQDLSMQGVITDQAIQIYERVVKFHIISHYKLRRNDMNSNSSVSPMLHLNMEQLTKTLSSLYHLYDQTRKPNPEFYSFYVLLRLGSDHQQAGESLSLWFRKVPFPVMKSKEMMFSRKLLRYSRIGNYKRFFETVDSEASRLQYYVVEPFLCEVRALALACLNYGGYKLSPYTVVDVSKRLFMEESDVESFCKDCGLDVFTGEDGMKFVPAKQTGFCNPKGSEKCYPMVSKRLKTVLIDEVPETI